MDKRSSNDWLLDPEFSEITIMDADGWDRRNFKESFSELISRKEFKQRLFRSTVKGRGFLPAP